MKNQIFYLLLLSGLHFGNLNSQLLSNFDCAATLGKMKWEITPGYSFFSITSDEPIRVTDNASLVSLRFGLGISEKFDIKLSYTRIIGDFDLLNFVEIIPKLSIVKNKIAAEIPVGLIFGDEGIGVLLRPKIILTYPVSNKFDLSFSPRFEYVLGDDKFYMNFSLGAGFSSDLKKWSIRPEFSIIPTPGYDTVGSIYIYGIGFKCNF
jgi:hypothetical protein